MSACAGYSQPPGAPSELRLGGRHTDDLIRHSLVALLPTYEMAIYQLSKRLNQEDKATLVRCGSDPPARSILLRSRNRIGFPICCNNDAKNVSGERVICCAKWY
jgi:hypothetical protein